MTNKLVKITRNDRTVIYLCLVGLLLISGLTLLTTTTSVNSRVSFNGQIALPLPLPDQTTTNPPSIEISTSPDPILEIEPVTPSSTTVPPVSFTTTSTTVYIPSPVTTTGSYNEPETKFAVTDDVWWELAGCETGYKYDNPNTGNGYFGYFQFSEPTWWGIGETGYAHQYSYEYQKEGAIRLQARSGWGQWPACSAKMRRMGLI